MAIFCPRFHIVFAMLMYYRYCQSVNRLSDETASSTAERQLLAAILLNDLFREVSSSVMASVVLAVVVAQMKGVKCYDLGRSGASRRERVVVLRRPDNVYSINCLDVRLLRGRLLLGHVDAPLAVVSNV